MIGEIIVRQAIDRDAEKVSKMICENAQALLYPHYNERQWAIFLQYYSSDVMREKINSQYVFCADLDGQIIGTIALDKDFIVGFYTRLQHVNQGVGRKMMKFVEDFALVKGLKRIQLAASPEGLSFYYKNGWKKIKDIIIEHYGVGFKETLMVKDLENDS